MGLPYLSRVPKNVGARRNVLRYQCARFDERSCANPNALEDGGVRPDPDVVFDNNRTAQDRRSRLPPTSGRASDRIQLTGNRIDRMKVCIGDRSVPAGDNIIADDDLELAQQHGAGENTVVTDPDARLLPHGEVHAVHVAALADDEAGIEPTMKSLEGKLAVDDGVQTNPYVSRQVTVSPPPGGQRCVSTQDENPPGFCSNWME